MSETVLWLNQFSKFNIWYGCHAIACTPYISYASLESHMGSFLGVCAATLGLGSAPVVAG